MKITYNNFKPLSITLEDDGQQKITIHITNVVIGIADLSMGGLVPDSPTLISVLESMQIVEITGDPLEPDSVYRMAFAMAPEFEKLANAIREELRKPVH